MTALTEAAAAQLMPRLALLLLMLGHQCPLPMGIEEARGATVLDGSGDVLDLCKSPIYCQGELLKTVQLAGLYKDSKTFVDLSQKNDEAVTLANFDAMMKSTNNKPSKEDVQKFVDDNFLDSDELQNATLPDWRAQPRLLKQIEDPDYRQWASNLNEIWKTLARHMTTDVRDNPGRHSLIYVNNSFVIPGGRFKEFYYWDSFWIVEGLLLSDMWDTARGVIENFLSMVNTYGFVPNGGRTYYLMRSQPPLLIAMVDKYFEFTKDWHFVSRNLPLLEKEFNYWQRYKTVQVVKGDKEYVLARYVTNSDGPRPESYREDYLLAENLPDAKSKSIFYNHVKAGAETGWDFSTRWFISEDGNPSLDLHDIRTQDIIPVDLNSFIEKNGRILSQFFQTKKNFAKAKYYRGKAKEYREAIEAVLWNNDDGIWYDYDARHQRPRPLFYPSNLTPLYTMSYKQGLGEILGRRSLEYLEANRIADYAGGVPASLDNSSQQWDFPNAWPPLQSLVVQGLRQTKYEPAMQFAEKLALTWLKSNYLGFSQTQKMFEKYDATQAGKVGGGGEYNVQDGFGWTNGVILEFLSTYPTARYSQDRNQTSNPTRAGSKLMEAISTGLSAMSRTRSPYRSRIVLKSIWSHYCA